MSVTLPEVIIRGTFAARPAAGSAGRLYFASDTGRQYRDNGVSWDGVTPGGLHGLGATFDGGGSPLSAGLVAYVTVPAGGTLAAWNIVADAGTCTVKLWKVARGTAKPTSANSINTSGVSLSTGTAIHSTALGDFTTTAFADGDIVGINLFAVSGATQVNFTAEVN